MGIAYPGSDNWYNSARRSAKLRAERQNHELAVKGTYKQRKKDVRKNIQLQAALDKENQLAFKRVEGKNSLVERALANRGNLEQQKLANKPRILNAQMQKDYYEGLGKQANLRARSDAISLQYADRRARKGVNLPPRKSSKKSKPARGLTKEEYNSIVGLEANETSAFDITELLEANKENDKRLQQLGLEQERQRELDIADINF